MTNSSLYVIISFIYQEKEPKKVIPIQKKMSWRRLTSWCEKNSNSLFDIAFDQPGFFMSSHIKFQLFCEQLTCNWERPHAKHQISYFTFVHKACKEFSIFSYFNKPKQNWNLIRKILNFIHILFESMWIFFLISCLNAVHFQIKDS